MTASSESKVPRGSRALVLGIRTALLLWIVGFFGRIPPAIIPSPFLAALLAGVLLSGGAAAGRLPRAGARDGALVGLVAALVSLLLLGSLLSREEPNALVPSALLWIPGYLGAGSLLGAFGALLGRAALRRLTDEPDWTARLTRVAATATLSLLAVGGLVTSKGAGLAVVDWPNSYGYNMFLYPISRMVGNVFFEHAHRLFGSFVGLTTLVVFGRVLATDRRRGARALAFAALVLVVGQGILGGLRVTGHFTTSTSPEVVRPNLTLAMVHGIVGQLFFALMVALAAITSPTWKGVRAEPDAKHAHRATSPASTDATLSLVLIFALLLQLLFGVQLRHLGQGAMVHITFSVFVVVLAVLVSIRLLAQAREHVVFRKTGAALLAHTGTQFLLGVATLISLTTSGFASVLFPTLHQTTGAILLGNAVLAHLWSRRFLPPGPSIAFEAPATDSSA